MDDLARRISEAGTGLLGLREPLVAAEPWPLSSAWGTEPEADWGAREVLAHVAEMLPYWAGQLERILAGDPSSAVPFGRVASDPDRLRGIDELRRRTSGELLDGISTGLSRVVGFVSGLTDVEGGRLGVHETRGELTVRESVERFLANHLEEHVAQVRAILERRAA